MPRYTSLGALTAAAYGEFKYLCMDDIALSYFPQSSHSRVGPTRHPLPLLLPAMADILPSPSPLESDILPHLLPKKNEAREATTTRIGAPTQRWATSSGRTGLDRW